MTQPKHYTDAYLAEADLKDEGFTRHRSEQHGNPEFWLSENGHVIAWVCRTVSDYPAPYFVKFIGN